MGRSCSGYAFDDSVAGTTLRVLCLKSDLHLHLGAPPSDGWELSEEEEAWPGATAASSSRWPSQLLPWSHARNSDRGAPASSAGSGAHFLSPVAVVSAGLPRNRRICPREPPLGLDHGGRCLLDACHCLDWHRLRHQCSPLRSRPLHNQTRPAFVAQPGRATQSAWNRFSQLDVYWLTFGVIVAASLVPEKVWEKHTSSRSSAAG
jgi:hypothetical protein